jgi:thiosulfate dehydrogenase [quinone] large subunit
MSAVFNNPRATRGNVVAIEESPVSRLFFANTRMSWLWLVVRLYVGYEWVMSALGKLGNPAWTGDKAGAAITRFVNGALQKAGGEHPDVTQWYASF